MPNEAYRASILRRARFTPQQRHPDDPHEAEYSPPTCYSPSCSTAGGGGEPSGSSSSCSSSALGGALAGSLLATAVCIGLMRPEKLRRVYDLFRSRYSHLTTTEMPPMEIEARSGAPAGAGLRPAGSSWLPHACTGSDPGLSSTQLALRRGESLQLPPLEPPLEVNGEHFERRWASCVTRSIVLVASLPATPPVGPPFQTRARHAPLTFKLAALSPLTHTACRPQVSAEAVEESLVDVGFFCVAAGAVGVLHKSYFTAQLSGSAEWCAGPPLPDRPCRPARPHPPLPYTCIYRKSRSRLLIAQVDARARDTD